MLLYPTNCSPENKGCDPYHHAPYEKREPVKVIKVVDVVSNFRSQMENSDPGCEVVVDLIGTLALLLAVAVVGGEIAGASGNLGGDLEENLAVLRVVFGPRRRHHAGVEGRNLALLDKVHDNGTAAVSASVLREVVAPGELLAALIALKGFLLGVQRSIVTLKMLLATESPVAKIANKGL